MPPKTKTKTIPTLGSQKIKKIEGAAANIPHTYTVESFTEPGKKYIVNYWPEVSSQDTNNGHYATKRFQRWSCNCADFVNTYVNTYVNHGICKHICIASRFQTETWDWLGKERKKLIKDMVSIDAEEKSEETPPTFKNYVHL